MAELISSSHPSAANRIGILSSTGNKININNCRFENCYAAIKTSDNSAVSIVDSYIQHCSTAFESSNNSVVQASSMRIRDCENLLKVTEELK